MVCTYTDAVFQGVATYRKGLRGMYVCIEWGGLMAEHERT
jgi:hypothetical protein